MKNEEIIERIVAELEKIAFADYCEIAKELQSEKFAPLISLLAEAEAYFPAVEKVKSVKDGIEIKFYDKLKALELLGKYARGESEEKSGDYDNLISILQSRANDVWEEGDND